MRSIGSKTLVRVGTSLGIVHIVAIMLSSVAHADDDAHAGGAGQHVAASATDVSDADQSSQFALPQRKPGTKGPTPPPAPPKRLELQYSISYELEAPYRNNADLDDSLPDETLSATPTINGTVTYRPFDWFEAATEIAFERTFDIVKQDPTILPDGSTQPREKRYWSLGFKQLYTKFKVPEAPVEFLAGRRTFGDSRLWIYDLEMETAMLTVKPWDFQIDAGFSRELAYDLNLTAPEIDSRVNNWSVIAEYRGIEDHRLLAYWFHRRDRKTPSEEGRPHFYGLRATGNPTNSFNYWIDAAIVRGRDENNASLRGRGLDVGGTYRFVDVPMQPAFTIGYAYGSGDDNPDDGRNSAFRQTGLQTNEGRLGGVSDLKRYGEVIDPELSNLDIYTLGLGFRPYAGIFLELVYHHYRLNALAEELRNSALTAELNQVSGRESKNVGDELDIVVGFRNFLGVRGLALDLRFGLFFPGKAFLGEDGSGNTISPDNGVSFITKFVF